MIADAREAAKASRQIVIFPEGTRRAIGAPARLQARRRRALSGARSSLRAGGAEFRALLAEAQVSALPGNGHRRVPPAIPAGLPRQGVLGADCNRRSKLRRKRLVAEGSSLYKKGTLQWRAPPIAPTIRSLRDIWDMKYRLKGPDGAPVDKTIEDTWRRVASAVAGAEKPPRPAPAGRAPSTICSPDTASCRRAASLSGAGTQRNVTLFNCFVMGDIEDRWRASFEGLKEAALTMQQGGGIGYDFSTLRPQGRAGQGRRRRCVRAR